MNNNTPTPKKRKLSTKLVSPSPIKNPTNKRGKTGTKPTPNKGILDRWINQLDEIPDEHELFNTDVPQDTSKSRFRLRKGMITDDARLASWRHLLKNMSCYISPIQNYDLDCHICLGKMAKGRRGENTYREFKFGGSINRQAHRIIFLLYNPNTLHALEKKTVKDKGDDSKAPHIIHRCHNTRCINYKHLALSTCSYNQTGKSCVNGCAALCPHYPTNCIFNDKDTGRYLPCWNDSNRYPPRKSEDCPHDTKCPTPKKRTRRINDPGYSL